MEPMDDTVFDPTDAQQLVDQIEVELEEAEAAVPEAVPEPEPVVVPEAAPAPAPEPVLPPEANVPVVARTTAESHYTRRERRLLQGTRTIADDPVATRGDGRDAKAYIDSHAPRKPHFGRFSDQMPHD